MLATYQDGSACLVVTAWDAGTLAVLNADLAASNLVRSPAFVLLEELLGQMRHGHTARRPVFCREPLVVRLPAATASAAQLKVVAAGGGEPEGGAPLGRLADESSGVVWRWPAPTRRGVYEVRHGEEAVWAVAVEVPPEESWLEGLEPTVLTDHLAAGRPVYYAGAAGRGRRRHDAWKWLAMACVLCLLGEVAALYVFRN